MGAMQTLGTLNTVLSHFRFRREFLNVGRLHKSVLSSTEQHASSGIPAVNSVSPHGKPLEALLAALENVDHLNINSFGY